MRIIGLDYGTKTVGVALSDALGITAQPVETITRKEAGWLFWLKTDLQFPYLQIKESGLTN